MKLLLITYCGTDDELIPDLLDRHHAGGYSELQNVHGSGSTGLGIAWNGITCCTRHCTSNRPGSLSRT